MAYNGSDPEIAMGATLGVRVLLIAVAVAWLYLAAGCVLLCCGAGSSDRRRRKILECKKRENEERLCHRI